MTARLARILGVVALAAAVLGWAWHRRSPGSATDPAVGVRRIEIQFAHFKLESGIREAFDALARDYMRLHPDVRIKQIAVPERTWKAWLRSQLVGGTAPDIIDISAVDDEMLVQYFEPVTPWVNSPNPYNIGNPLEKIPWRQTFLDGLTSAPSYNSRLMDYYGIPTTYSTTRVAYNRQLLRELTGDDRPPETYEQFIALCQRVVDISLRDHRRLVPLTGSAYNTQVAMLPLFATQTQRMGLKLDPLSTLNVTVRESAPAYLRGIWSLRDPAIMDGLALWHEVGQYVQPGFLQLGKQDAQFFFEQGYALFIGIPSRDLTTLIHQCPFDVGVFNIPQPETSHPRFGHNILGRMSEAATPQEASFGVASRSAHPEVAIDFLRFLSSQPNARKFTELSNWLPAVVGVEPNPAVAAFRPLLDGVTNGFGIHFLNYGGGHTRQLYDELAHQIFSARGTPEAFVDALERGGYREKIAADVAHTARVTRTNVRRTDSTFMAYRRLSQLDPADRSLAAKMSLLMETQNIQEAEALQLQYVLARSANRPTTP